MTPAVSTRSCVSGRPTELPGTRLLTTSPGPTSKEPVGLCRSDGKPPGSLTLSLWQEGKPRQWDIPVVAILAVSCVSDSWQQFDKRKICSSPGVLRFQAQSDRVVGLSRRVSVETVLGFRSQHHFSHRRWPGRSVSYSTVASLTSTFAPELCWEWGAGPLDDPSIVFNFSALGHP